MKRFGLTGCLMLCLALPGCGSFRLFADYKVEESPDVAAAAWPRLVDTPAAPPPGQYSEAVPDPAQGVALQSQLSAVAARSAARAGGLAEPVLSEEERGALLPDAADGDGARPAAAPRPVLTPADRARLNRPR